MTERERFRWAVGSLPSGAAAISGMGLIEHFVWWWAVIAGVGLASFVVCIVMGARGDGPYFYN